MSEEKALGRNCCADLLMADLQESSVQLTSDKMPQVSKDIIEFSFHKRNRCSHFGWKNHTIFVEYPELEGTQVDQCVQLLALHSWKVKCCVQGCCPNTYWTLTGWKFMTTFLWSLVQCLTKLSVKTFILIFNQTHLLAFPHMLSLKRSALFPLLPLTGKIYTAMNSSLRLFFNIFLFLL